MKLNLGCGARLMTNYLNIDYRKPVCGTEGFEFREADCRDLSFLSDNSIEEIYAEQLIEHIHPMQIAETLYEWCRVLTLNGKLILIYPDFDKVVHVYQEHKDLRTTEDWFWFHRLCYMVLNSTVQNLTKADPHRCLITEGFLRLHLAHEGFAVLSCKDFGSDVEELYYSKLVANKTRQS